MRYVAREGLSNSAPELIKGEANTLVNDFLEREPVNSPHDGLLNVGLCRPLGRGGGGGLGLARLKGQDIRVGLDYQNVLVGLDIEDIDGGRG